MLNYNVSVVSRSAYCYCYYLFTHSFYRASHNYPLSLYFLTQYSEGCKTDSTITQAAFNGKSFARQHVDVIITDQKSAMLRIYVKLKTAFKNGIILHVYFDNERYSLVYLELGSLKFQFSCGLETMLLGEIDAAIDSGFEVGIDMRYLRIAHESLCLRM